MIATNSSTLLPSMFAKYTRRDRTNICPYTFCKFYLEK
ncbi:MAG: hypothetical protein ACLR2O_08850 [Coprococcus sp.]